MRQGEKHSDSPESQIKSLGKTEAYSSDRHSRCRSVLGTVQSKFRHLETSSGANKQCFTNLRQVSTRMPTESNGFCVSNKYAAIPLASTGGVVAICDVSGTALQLYAHCHCSLTTRERSPMASSTPYGTPSA